jgi:DNA-binding GntR family transcriptional regulator
VRLIRPAWENSERYRALAMPTHEMIRERQVEHERILAACVAGDGTTAARELRSHLELTAQVVSAQLAAQASTPSPTPA